MIEEPLLTRARGLSDDAFVRTRGRKVFVTTVPRAVSWYWVCVDVVLGGCALLVLAPASVRQGPGVG